MERKSLVIQPYSSSTYLRFLFAYAILYNLLVNNHLVTKLMHLKVVYLVNKNNLFYSFYFYGRLAQLQLHTILSQSRRTITRKFLSPVTNEHFWKGTNYFHNPFKQIEKNSFAILIEHHKLQKIKCYVIYQLAWLTFFSDCWLSTIGSQPWFCGCSYFLNCCTVKRSSTYT